ncbi:RnfABCDGE type electron transport complex subunit A [Clostridium botulinum]|uniref:Ion-translocating oxidoreductase complex subunit A n=1 Tax=Clostridium botulinum C/D str. DC5 TaxID=1443128 RepID=A0A0A0IAR0_CLOBO|nr:RnfABCDGE type electron transport complex subunit A [Clostridium botulinum]KEI03180.1 electron transporter RnfA [Clostridium botulinum C/D str. BKT75002]KEI07555.1 electron transporter RnfA [Clostridium botulinum C/D str. BKT2873]KGM93767.1 electron transporter RnfA [Clostridium botulinum D str. CCUG 7971]KGM98539.1 electron transporter RnfA [Clostridium botulinum C/D str. DC5]KOC49747.1 electron transporter RnfA [Clostridium botulinum]
MGIFTLVISSLLVNNMVLSKFLGICAFLGVSKKVETAKGMGMAVTFVMTLASVISYVVLQFILKPLHIEYMSTIAFILVIAALVQFVEMVLKKVMPELYKALGIFLPLITTNCAILGAVIINMNNQYSLVFSLISGLASGLGWMLSIVLLAGLRERMEANDKMPEAIKGLPAALITAGLMAIAFLGFSGLV